MSQELSAILNVIRACVAGDVTARHRFQEDYGEDIYNFPVKIYRLPVEKAVDFYVYVFEKDRIFARLKTFAGRNNIQFRTFLSYYVLKTLFFEWQRTVKEVETISLNTPLDTSAEGERTLEDILPDPATAKAEEREAPEDNEVNELWASLEPYERLDLKLLYLIESELTPSGKAAYSAIAGRAGSSCTSSGLPIRSKPTSPHPPIANRGQRRSV